ncbi:MAG: type IX secretion system membrane protein PorP/SprF [Saprospiraceae bacterium]|nr:type IX secretion system membrane protein PorP/SprF [Saprospiraceae bacterium]
MKNLNIYIKRVTYSLVFLFFALNIFAQQENHFTQFMYNKLLLNPAFASAREVASISGIYRNQWLGFNGAPKAMLLSFDAPFFNNRVGFGMNLVSEQKGITKKYYASLAYSYSIVRTEDIAFRIGLQGVLRNYNLDFTGSDQFYIDNPFLDPSIQYNSKISQIRGNVGVGVYFDYKEFFFGASVPNLYKNVIGINKTTNTEIAEEFQHFYLMSGFLLPLSEKIFLKPSGILKFVKNAPIDFDLNLSLFFNNRFSIGGSYRDGDSVDFTTFMQVTKNLGIGAAYDFTTSELSKYNNGSIEVLLRYDFGSGASKSKFGKDIQNLSNPRFFF